MPPVSRTTCRRFLRRLDRDAFVRFVADCWASRGFETTVEDGIVEAVDRRGVAKRLLVLHGATEPAVPDGIDAVVTNRPVAASAEGPRVLDADDLHGLLLYGLDREVADGLCREYFGRPLDVEPTPTPWERLGARLPVGSAGPAPVAALGVVTLVLLAGVAVSLGAPGLGSPAAEAQPTATPERLPTWIDQPIRDTPYPGPFGGDSQQLDDPPPWAAANGSVDVRHVVTAHGLALHGRSFRFTLLRREDGPNRTRTSVRQTVAVERPGVYLMRLERSDTTAGPLRLVRAIYVNDTGRYAWGSDGRLANRSVPMEQPTADGPAYDELAITSLYWLLAAPDPRITDVDVRDGVRLYRVDLSYEGSAEIERIEGHAHVDTAGRVHSVYKTYTFPRGVEVALVARYGGFGATNVEPPAFLPDQPANASRPG